MNIESPKVSSIKIQINYYSDKLIMLILILIMVFCYLKLSLKDTMSFVYLLTLIWYIVNIFCFIKVRIFSGLGLYILDMLFFVQSGVLMQGIYFTFDKEVTKAIIIYNILAPCLVFFVSKFKSVHVVGLKKIKVSSMWVTLLFLCGCTSIILYFFTVGTIPILATDAENFRVQALSGKAFLVVIASNCFSVAVLMTEKKVTRYFRTIISIIFLLGTGFRSSAFSIILIFFLTYWVGEKRKIVFRGILIGTILSLMYSIIGVFRSGAKWSLLTLYKPMLWRFYVNTNNFNSVYTLFPVNQFQYGKTLLNDFLVILPGPQDTYMTKLKDILDIQFSGGSLTPSVFGEGYYNWGYAGAIMWPLFLLMFVMILDNYNRKHMDVRIYYALSCGLMGISISCLMPTILNTYLPLLLVYYTLIYVSKNFKLTV